MADNNTRNGNEKMIATGYIVKGIVAGTFVILAESQVAGENGFAVKSVNPNNHSETAPGELWLPADRVRELTAEEKAAGLPR